MGKTTRTFKPVSIGELGERVDTELVPLLRDMIAEAEQYKGNLNEQHRDYMRMWLGVPDQATKEFPWPKASNVWIPVTRVLMDALLSQVHDAMLSGQPQISGFDNSDLDVAEKLGRFYFEHVWVKMLNLKQIGNDFLFNTLLDGTAIVKNRWDRDAVLRRFYHIEDIPRYEGDIAVVDGVELAAKRVVDIDRRIVEEVKMERAERPRVDVVDIARFYPSPNSASSLQWPDCEWFYEETFLTWDQLQQKSGWENIDDALKASLKEYEGEKDRELEEAHRLGHSGMDRARVLMFHMRLVLPLEYTDTEGDTKRQQFMAESGIKEDVVVVYLADVEKVARIIPISRLRSDHKRPYIVNRYKSVPNFFFGIGVPYSMRHLQRMVNSLYNQMIDYGTLQNLPFFFYDPSSVGLLPEGGAIQPGAMIPVGDPSRITAPRLQGDRLFWPQALQTSQTWIERDSSINDFNLGRSPEVPNAPRTFRGQAQMLNQANLMFSRMVDLMSQPFVELLRQVHNLYNKHAPDDVEFEFFDEATRLFKRETIHAKEFKEDIDFRFLINPNRMQERQDNQMLFQLMMSVPFVQQQPEAVRALARDLFTSMGKKNFEEIWPSQQPLEVQQQQQLGQEQAQQVQQLPLEQGLETAQPQPSVAMAQPLELPPPVDDEGDESI